MHTQPTHQNMSLAVVHRFMLLPATSGYTVQLSRLLAALARLGKSLQSGCLIPISQADCCPVVQMYVVIKSLLALVKCLQPGSLALRVMLTAVQPQVVTLNQWHASS